MARLPVRVLATLDPSEGHAFTEPSKRIHEHQHVNEFLASKAYTDIMTFLLQLNRSLFSSLLPDGKVQSWPLHSDAVEYSAPVRQLQQLLNKLESIIQEAPPDTGPRRFGNVSFRKWYKLVESRASELLDEHLSSEVLQRKSSMPQDTTTTVATATAKTELMAYFLGSWGSPQRLDYGTGHELSFLAFLAGLWKLNGFPKTDQGVEERAIVLGVIEPYLELVRTLIKTYTLEPAGSHGVWGLDDHSFIPYIFGSAQLGPPISDSDLTPEEGSLDDAPSPQAVTKPNLVERERQTNMYFSAIGFIYDVKKGPFWEHSRVLYDISGITAGWAKINKGMIKMYNAEVLSKFPVVQHFPFGSLFSWDRDPNAVEPPAATYAPPGPATRGGVANSTASIPGPTAEHGTQAPWAIASPASSHAISSMPSTTAPWASARTQITSNLRSVTDGSGSLTDTSRLPPGPMAPTRAPWAQADAAGPVSGTKSGQDITTRAPWARKE